MRNKGKEGTEAFNELPIAFQAELSLETYQNMILKVIIHIDIMMHVYCYCYWYCCFILLYAAYMHVHVNVKHMKFVLLINDVKCDIILITCHSAVLYRKSRKFHFQEELKKQPFNKTI